MVTINGNESPQRGHATVRVSLALWVGLGGLMTAFSTAIAGVLWLGQMRADIDANHRLVMLEHAGIRAAITELQGRTERMDTNGTRALGVVQKDIGTLQGTNQTQDNRITRNDGRVDELIKQTQENKFWVDQMRELIRSYSHQRSPP